MFMTNKNTREIVWCDRVLKISVVNKGIIQKFFVHLCINLFPLRSRFRARGTQCWSRVHVHFSPNDIPESQSRTLGPKVKTFGDPETFTKLYELTPWSLRSLNPQ
jgi:hypothetical protein